MKPRSRFRITGGRFKGRLLAVPSDTMTRPMQGALRETVFNVLRPEVSEARVLDLFSGTGSLGLEALSRGAACCDFFENHKPAVQVLNANIDRLDCKDAARIFTQDLLKLRTFPDTPCMPYDIVFLDPPFRFNDPGSERDLSPLIGLLCDAKALAPGAALVFQFRIKQTPPPELGPFLLEKEKKHGSVRLAFYRFQDDPSSFEAGTSGP